MLHTISLILADVMPHGWQSTVVRLIIVSAIEQDFPGPQIVRAGGLTWPDHDAHSAPISILYDMKIAVARILGDGKRQRTRAFTELVSHYLFQERFGRPGKGNGKGKVEALGV